MAKWLEPVEAFRMLLVFRMQLRPPHPRYATFAAAIGIAGAITSDEWFANRQDPPVPAEVRLAACGALEAFCSYVRERRIGLRGELHSGVPPIPIDEIECAHGVLDVFGATLKVRSRIYRYVLCNGDDVATLIDSTYALPQQPGAYNSLIAALEALAAHHYEDKSFPFSQLGKFDSIRPALNKLRCLPDAAPLVEKIESQLAMKE
jgi:hypothetical protein